MDLENGILLAIESQDQIAFTLGWATKNLLLASARLPAQPHSMSWNGSSVPAFPPTSMIQCSHIKTCLCYRTLYIDFTKDLQERGWALNPQKIQGPGTALKF